MSFEPGTDHFCGILKSFKVVGYPQISLSSSGAANDMRKEENVLDYNNITSHFASLDTLDAYFTVEIVNKPFQVTHYALRSHENPQACLRGWKIEGSMNNYTYELLDRRGNTTDLENSGSVLYQVNPAKRVYKFFRIMSTMSTLTDEVLRVSNFDLYGTFNYGLSYSKCICTGNYILYLFIVTLK